MLAIIFAQSSSSEGRQTVGAIYSLMHLHCRRQDIGMVEAKQVANLMDKRCLEVVSTRTTVSGKLQGSSLCRPRMRIKTDVCLCDHSGFRIIEDSCSPGRRTDIKKLFIFWRVGNR